MNVVCKNREYSPSFAEYGLDRTLNGDTCKPRGKILDGEQEAKIIALRLVHAKTHRTKLDWSEEVYDLLNLYPEAKKVILICDHLNTHDYGSFYDRYPAEQAFSICQRLDIRNTSKHDSWLNNVSAWNGQRNTQEKGVEWQYTQKMQE